MQFNKTKSDLNLSTFKRDAFTKIRDCENSCMFDDEWRHRRDRGVGRKLNIIVDSALKIKKIVVTDRRDVLPDAKHTPSENNLPIVSLECPDSVLLSP